MIKLAFFEIEEQFEFGGDGFFDPVDNWCRSYREVDVKPLITLPPCVEIYDALIEQIKIANQYIFLEGYALFDMEMVNNLYEQLRAKPQLKVIVMISFPPCADPNNISDRTQAYLTGLALRILTTVNSNTTHVEINGVEIPKSDVSLSFSGEISGTEVISSLGKNNICDISGFKFQSDKSSQALFCSAFKSGNSNPRGAYYIHSKMALFDDICCIIGSANFTERSLKEDTEYNVQINDEATVTGIRQRLLAHYFAAYSCDHSCDHSYPQYADYQKWQDNIRSQMSKPEELQNRVTVRQLKIEDFQVIPKPPLWIRFMRRYSKYSIF